eukprot:COSAG05_NODE_13033_length_444_cov_0.846377_2_plen_30_part_01
MGGDKLKLILLLLAIIIELLLSNHVVAFWC